MNNMSNLNNMNDISNINDNNMANIEPRNIPINKINIINNVNNVNNINFLNDMNMSNMNNQFNNFQNNNLNPNNNNFNQNITKKIITNVNKENIKVVIQCLSKCLNITNYFLNKTITKDYLNFVEVFPITSSYTKMIENAFKNYKNFEYIDVKSLKKIIDKNYCYDSDMPENIYKFIIEKIHKEIKFPFENNNNFQLNTVSRGQIYNNFYNKQFLPENTSIISKNFFGIKEVDIKCEKCKQINYEFEIFKFIEFPIKEIYQNIVYKAQMLIQCGRDKSFINLMNNIYSKKITLDDCFDFYMNFNQNKNNFLCNKCNIISQNSTYYYRLILLPNILCIILNFEGQTIISVDIPEKLDISKYLENFVEKKYYELIGIIFYSKEQNNFFSLSRKKSDEQWYLYNQKSKKAIKSNFIDTKKKGIPYILFYEQNIIK